MTDINEKELTQDAQAQLLKKLINMYVAVKRTDNIKRSQKEKLEKEIKELSKEYTEESTLEKVYKVFSKSGLGVRILREVFASLAKNYPQEAIYSLFGGTARSAEEIANILNTQNAEANRDWFFQDSPFDNFEEVDESFRMFSQNFPSDAGGEIIQEQEPLTQAELEALEAEDFIVPNDDIVDEYYIAFRQGEEAVQQVREYTQAEIFFGEEDNLDRIFRELDELDEPEPEFIFELDDPEGYEEYMALREAQDRAWDARYGFEDAIDPEQEYGEFWLGGDPEEEEALMLEEEAGTELEDGFLAVRQFNPNVIQPEEEESVLISVEDTYAPAIEEAVENEKNIFETIKDTFQSAKEIYQAYRDATATVDTTQEFVRRIPEEYEMVEWTADDYEAEYGITAVSRWLRETGNVLRQRRLVNPQRYEFYRAEPEERTFGPEEPEEAEFEIEPEEANIEEIEDIMEGEEVAGDVQITFDEETGITMVEQDVAEEAIEEEIGEVAGDIAGDIAIETAVEGAEASAGAVAASTAEIPYVDIITGAIAGATALGFGIYGAYSAIDLINKEAQLLKLQNEKKQIDISKLTHPSIEGKYVGSKLKDPLREVSRRQQEREQAQKRRQKQKSLRG